MFTRKTQAKMDKLLGVLRDALIQRAPNFASRFKLWKPNMKRIEPFGKGQDVLRQV